MKTISKRILVKISGDLFSYERSLRNFTKDLCKLLSEKYEILIVLGGGNLIRGSSDNLVPSDANDDYAGMLSTAINGLSLQKRLTDLSIPSLLYSPFSVGSITSTFNCNDVNQLLRTGIPLFVCGLGIPYVSTDTAAVHRSIELHCEYVIKLSKSNFVHENDPEKHSNAPVLRSINYDFVVKNRMSFMDIESITIAERHNVSIFFTSFHNSFYNVCKGNVSGTWIGDRC